MIKPFAAFTENFRRLPTRKEKLCYLMDYGKLWILAAVCLVSFLSFTVFRAATAVRENHIYAVFVNTYAEVGNGSEFRKGLVKYSGWDPKEKNVQVEANTFFSYSKNEGRGNTYYDAFVSFIDAGALDAAIMPAEELTAFGSTGRLMDLQDERCSRILTKYADRLIYSVPLNPEYGGKPVPVGIDISDSPIIARYSVYDCPCALGIGAFSEHIESVEKLLSYLFAEETL